MSWDQNDFSGYSFSEYSQTGKTPAEEITYADPRFYEARPASAPQSVPRQPTAQPMPGVNLQIAPYRDPQDLPHYAADAEKTQQEAATQGLSQDKSPRRGLAALGGLGTTLALVAKFGVAGVSALISVAVYSWIFGWAFAVGLVMLLLIHELGHALVMKLKGLPIGGLVFIPLFGAAVLMNRMPKNAKDEAEVGIAGPVAGAIAASVCLLIAFTQADRPGIWASLAYFGFFLNLVNLIPIVPFDGGRVLAAIDRRIWIVGFVGLVAFEIWTWIQATGSFWQRIDTTSSFWLFFFIIMAATQLLARRSNTPETRAYYAVPLHERAVLGLAYFSLIAVLVLGMSLAHSLMPF
jgi:Zn-dependent protease